MQLTQEKLESLVSKKSLLRYLRSLPPDTTFDMEDGCNCAYHGLLCARLALDDDLVGAYMEEFMVGDEELWVSSQSFAARFQTEAAAQQRDREKPYSFAPDQTNVALLIALAKGMDE